MRTLWAGAAARLAAWPAAWYIEAQRDRLAREGERLDRDLRKRFSPYFDDADLERVRLLTRHPLPVPDPPLAAHVRRLGFDFPSMAEVGGIAFDHVIALWPHSRASLVFHEMVHVVQYRLLGIREFARLYARGFLATGCYDDIPLERNAAELERRFEGEVPFSVEAEVAAWIGGGRF